VKNLANVFFVLFLLVRHPDWISLSELSHAVEQYFCSPVEKVLRAGCVEVSGVVVECRLVVESRKVDDSVFLGSGYSRASSRQQDGRHDKQDDRRSETGHQRTLNFLT